MGIRNYIQDAPTTLEETVTYEGDKFFLAGTTNMEDLTNTLMMSQVEAELQAKHWSAVTKTRVSVDNVRHIAMVHAALRPLKWDPETEKFVDDVPYDITEIARLSVTNSGLFLQLMQAAYKVFGLVKNGDGFDRIASGNSETENLDS